MTRATGILADRAIAALFEAGRLKSEARLDEDQIQPASLDLRLGSIAFRVRASFMPGPGHLVADKLDRLKLHVIDLSEGAVLETGCVYIVPLMESLDLLPDMSASANPKSSTGRLDIFTRVITDRAQEFDKIPPAIPVRSISKSVRAPSPSSSGAARACRRSASASAMPC